MISQPPAIVLTSTRETLRGVARHALPTVVEATLIPSALFFTAWMTLGKWPAFIAAGLWGYGALARHVRSGDRVPGLLILALVGLTVRTTLALATGSTFLYFAQPIVGTSLMAMLFLGSAMTTRPFVARLAADFYPLTPQIAARSRVKRLFRDLTLLWAGINLVNAAVALSLLMTMRTGAFIPTKTAVGLSITTLGVVVTVWLSLRVVRSEGLHLEQPAVLEGHSTSLAEALLPGGVPGDIDLAAASAA